MIRFKIILLTTLLLATAVRADVGSHQAGSCLNIILKDYPRQLIAFLGGSEYEILNLDKLISQLDPVDQRLANSFYPPKETYYSDPQLMLEWRGWSPEFVKKDENGQLSVLPSSKPHIRYIAPNLYDGVIEQVERGRKPIITRGVHGFTTPWVSLPNLYNSIYNGYAGRIKENIIKLVKKVDRYFSDSSNHSAYRQSYGLVSHVDGKRNSRGEPEAIGTIRVVDGSVNKAKETLESPWLPLEYTFRTRDLVSKFKKTLDYLEHLRTALPEHKIFELGKFSINESSDSSIRARVRNVIELWVYRMYLRVYPEATFFVHVTTPAHLRLYRSRYGFEVLEQVRIPDGSGGFVTESILISSVQKLKKRMEELHNLPSD